MVGGMSERVLRRRKLCKHKIDCSQCHNDALFLYDCEVWSLKKQQQRRVQATQMNMMRRIQGVSRLDKTTSKEIRERLGQEDILDVIRRQQNNVLS